jgi:hypothetical protein
MVKRDWDEHTDRIRLKQRFDEFADNVLPGEGFPEDEIIDAMIRSLCRRIDNRDELMKRVNVIADRWFDEDDEEWFDE